MIRGELADRTRQLVDDRTPFVLATVVRARRPTSVRPGDSALILGDGRIEGFVGGLCAESSVRLYSLRALETGEALLLRLEPDAGGAEPGEGGEPGGPGASPASRGTDDGAVVEHNPCLSGGALEIFLEPLLPAPRIVVAGGSPIATALERLARAAGYDVARADEVQPDAGDSAVVVASHGADEERVLSAALAAGVPYVALVASTTRGEAVRAALDVPDELRGQVRTPAGLDIGARTPPEIAISILAEIVAEHHAHPAKNVSIAVDPVCGMEVAVTAATPSLEAGGEPVFFCGAACRDAYAKRG